MSIDETVRDGVSVSAGQFAQLMEAITASQTRMDERFAEFRTEVRQGQEDAAAKALKRARYEKPYEFKRKGADFHNRQMPRFNSRCWNPGAEAVDAFTVHWGLDNNWWCPPVALIPRIIGHARVCEAVGTLIVPYWPSAPFWPLVHPAVGSFANFVTDVRDIPLSELLILPGLSGSSLFDGQIPNTKVLALRCNFTNRPH